MEKLDLTTLTIAKQNVPYVKIKKGRFAARFLRPAYYEFMKYADKDERGFYVKVQGKKHYLDGPGQDQ